MARLIGNASQSKSGLMPYNMFPFNKDTASGLDFNSCRDLWRLYCSYAGSNTPIEGAYYWGIFNIGFSGDWLVQIACGTYTDGRMRMYRRMFHSGSKWTSWTQF